MNIEQKESVQDWLPIEMILNNGIIKMKNSSYIKILKVSPINYNLKSDFDKEAIINSYKNLFKSINFNFQILIQSKKEDLSNHINEIKKYDNYQEIRVKYINYLKKLIDNKKSSSKNFYLILCDSISENSENVKIQNLQDNYFKVRDLLSRCGNIISEITKEKDVLDILYSILNSKKY